MTQVVTVSSVVPWFTQKVPRVVAEQAGLVPVELTLTPPATSSFWVGAVVPMPMLPALSIRKRSALAVDPDGVVKNASLDGYELPDVHAPSA
jgi:hypothetical protein